MAFDYSPAPSWSWREVLHENREMRIWRKGIDKLLYEGKLQFVDFLGSKREQTKEEGTNSIEHAADINEFFLTTLIDTDIHRTRYILSSKYTCWE